MSIEEQRRHKFETAYPRPNGVVWNSITSDYWEDWPEMGDDRAEEIGAYNERWKTWNAALDSVVIELTYVPVLKVDGSGLDGIDCAYLQRDGVLDSIEAAGLKVKP